MRRSMLRFGFFSLCALVASAATSTESNAAIGTFPASQIAGSTSTDFSALASQTPSLETAPASQTLPASVSAAESSILSSQTTALSSLPSSTANAAADASSSITSLASSTVGQTAHTASPSVIPARANGGPTLNTTIIVIIAVAAGALLLLAVGITAFCCVRRRHRRREALQRTASSQAGSRARDYVDLEKTAPTTRTRGPNYRGVENMPPLKTDFGVYSCNDAFSSPVQPTAPRAAEKKQRKKRSKPAVAAANTNKDLPLGPAEADAYKLGQSLDDDAEAGMLGLSPESPLSLLANGRFSHSLRAAAADRTPMPPPPPNAITASHDTYRAYNAPQPQQQQQQNALTVPSASAHPDRAYSPSLYSTRDSMASGAVLANARAASTQLIVPEQEASRFSFGFGAGPAPHGATPAGPAFPTAANLAAARLGVPGPQRRGSQRSMNSGGGSSVFESAPWPPTSWAAKGAQHVGRWV